MTEHGPMGIQRNSQAFIIFFSAFLLFAAPQFLRPVSTRGEAREAIVAQAMLQQHSFILPLRNASDIPSKPPMLHWLIVLASKCCGALNSFSIRLPSALLGASLLGFFFNFLCTIANSRRALLSTLILGSAFEWFRSSTHARVDMCFTFGITIALFALFNVVERWQKKAGIDYRQLIIAAFAAAFAALSKGPTGIVIIMGISVGYLLISLETPRLHQVARLPWLALLSALGLATLIAGSWYYLAYELHGSEFLTVQLLKENVGRLVEIEGDNRGHEHPFFFSLFFLLAAFLPWSLLLPTSILSLWKNRQQYLQCDQGFFVFAVIWVLVFIVLVSFSVSKRVVYFLPALPPLAYLTTLALET
ncbi:MAG: glycosyltransferase family 39 protein, partial [Bdellovibrionales bacterium]|nr:glycosyltransferase family 39 protein [Bdellovibrionales bacterium]